MALWKSKEVIARATGATSHGNHHSIVSNFRDISHIVKILTAEQVFDEKIGRGSGENGETEFTDLFGHGTAALATAQPLHRYLRRARANWADEGQGNEEREALFDDDMDDSIENQPRELDPDVADDT